MYKKKNRNFLCKTIYIKINIVHDMGTNAFHFSIYSYIYIFFILTFIFFFILPLIKYFVKFFNIFLTKQ